MHLSPKMFNYHRLCSDQTHALQRARRLWADCLLL